tara:strand:+ start:176 stop:442 length:267 start_codon:yes stop_codon:yes gene_type:complete
MKEKLLNLISAINTQFGKVPSVASNGMLMLWNPDTTQVGEEIQDALNALNWQANFRDGDRQFDPRLTFSPKPTVESVADRALKALEQA